MNRLITLLFVSMLFGITQAQLTAPEYHKGKATLTGKIANYNPSANLDFKIGAPNIVMGAAETLYPTIEPDGSFSINIPVYHDTQVRMMLGKADILILVSPDKKTNVAINLDQPKGKQFVFDGQYASINNEWVQPDLKTRMPLVYREGDILDSIVGIHPNEFKRRCIDQYNQYVAHNNSQKQFSEDARTLANLSCAFDCLLNLQTAHYCLQTAYQKKENITREQAFAAFIDTHLPDDFYDDCLKNFPVNNPLAFYCYNYRDALQTFYKTQPEHLIIEKYLLENVAITQEEQKLIREYIAAFKAGITFQQLNEIMTITIKYTKETEDFRWKHYSQAKEHLIQTMQDSTCQFIDYVRAKQARSSFYNLQPLTAQQETLVSEITTPIFLGIIQDMNQQMQPRQKAEVKKCTVREAPQVQEKDLLAAIIDRYKGKVLFIDFWATWCGGCRQIIKEYEPLKNELPKDKVAFVYLTGPSSNAKAWDILIQNISGDHYWLNNEQWAYLWKHFEMTGLPMYLLIDKQGNIAKRFIHITAKEVKELLEEEVNKP